MALRLSNLQSCHTQTATIANEEEAKDYKGQVLLYERG